MSDATPFSHVLGRARRVTADPGHYVRAYAKRVRRAVWRQLGHMFGAMAYRLQSRMAIDDNSLWYSPDFARATGGFFPLGERPGARQVTDLVPWDSVRRDMLLLLVRSVLTRNVPGDFAELGVYRGDTARLFHRYVPERTLHLFDTFAGFEEGDREREAEVTGLRTWPGHFADTNVRAVLDYVGRPTDTVHAHPGRFPDSCPVELHNTTFAFVHLDADLYAPTMAGLRFFYPRMAEGGVIVCHDYNTWPGARLAVDEFFADKPEVPIPMPDVSGSAVIVKY